MLMDTISAGVVQLKFDGPLSLIYLNKSGAEILGYTSEQLKAELDNGFINMVHADDRESFKASINILIKNGNVSPCKHRLVCRGGRVLWVSSSSCLHESVSNEKIVVITFTDITEYKDLEKHYLQRVHELILKKKRSELAIINSDIIVLDYVLAGQQIIYPQFVMDKYGVPRKTNNAADTIINQKLVHPNSIKEVKRAFEEIHAGVPTVNAMIILLDKKNNNKEVILDVSATNIFDEKGNPVRAIIVLRNITKQILSENADLYKRALTAGNIINYEINVTRDLFISGAESWKLTLKMPTNSFSQIIAVLTEKIIYEEDRKQFSEFMSRDVLEKLFESGKETTTLEYRRLNTFGKYSWVSNRIHLIYDDKTRCVKALSYVHDINDKKVRESKESEKKAYYEMMLSKSAIIQELNLTKNQFILGHQKTFETFKLSYDVSYTDLMEELIQKVLHPEDSIIFRATYSRESLIQAYQDGIKTINCEYRRKDENEQMVWFSCVVHLFEDVETNDLKGFCYVQNIHAEKSKHLDLMYKAEHDALTTLYNKATTEMKIKEFLSSGEAEAKQHAFLIFDIDFFKPINDNFGHAFGDALLSQVGKKVKKLFREGDIIGRIGGDEFVVFMKNIKNPSIALEKAAEICTTIRESYRQKGKVYNISSSIGISYYNQHGTTYQELYEKADAALYNSKEKGKNRYSLHSENMDYKKNVVQNIYQREYLESRSFDANVSEYVFRILYEAKNRTEAIKSILELVGKHYKVSRSYIYENSPDGFSLSFEWCNEGILSQRQNLQNIKLKQISDYSKHFNHDGILCMPDMNAVQEEVKDVWKTKNVKSMLHFSIIKEDVFSGFVGFDQDEFIRESDKKEMTELKNIANLLAVFILDIRASEANEAIKNMALSIVNSLHSYAYVINCATYELLFINERTKVIAPDAKVGDTCYKNFWKRDKPCNICPMKILQEKNATRHSEEIYNDILDVWVKATATWVDWTGGQKSCMMENIDITEYKKVKS